MRRIAVIGAGIVGASVAFRLAQGGARVWIIDKKSQPARGTTSISFAWVNANEKTPRDYFELNYTGLKEHFRLLEELSGRRSWLKLGGNLEWAEDEAAQDKLCYKVNRLHSWGYTVQWREAAWLNEFMEPHVVFPSPDTSVAFFSEEVWVDAPQLTNALIDLARKHGAQLGLGVAVESIETKGGRVAALRLSNGERLPIDAVVNAAGAEADHVAALLGLPLPLKLSKGLLIRLAMKEEAPLGRIVHSPLINLRPAGSRHLLVHHRSVDEKLENDSRETAGSLCQELLERARQVVPALNAASVEDILVGDRPVPKDGRSCVGAVSAVPGYYEAVTHSGVTLGLLIGRLLAQEILTGEVEALISPFRPDRFARR
ncbi:MAG: FAD-dependent oxidoreductase [Rubrobacter sp.]|nr:FAD-dependent oxidoreductase [Rubrobacter sp.]